MDELQRFRGEIDSYLSKTGLTPTAFGEKAASDPNFVFELRNGREPRRSTIAKVRTFMANRRKPLSRETPSPTEVA
jgi:hypothetical protein